MALPESFQIALKRAEDERRLERENVLQRIGETVQKGVPLLSGVVAGALARSPIVGIGASFVADALQARFERKREERTARRMEMRQREAAAEIAVREGLFQDKKSALQAIEASRIQDELENTRRREEALLNQFNLQRQQEEVQEQQEQIVREQSEEGLGEGLALQSTLAHVDNEISGIADLLLDRFADEENRFARDQDRRELEAAQLRETVSEASRGSRLGQPQREDRPDDESEKDSSGFGGLFFVGRIAGAFTGVLKAIGFVALLLGIKWIIDNFEVVTQILANLGNQIYEAIKKALTEVLPDFGFGDRVDTLREVRTLDVERRQVQSNLEQEKQDQQRLIGNRQEAQQRLEDLRRENAPILDKLNRQEPLTAEEGDSFASFLERQNIINEEIDSWNQAIQSSQSIIQTLTNQYNDLVDKINNLLQQQTQTPQVNTPQSPTAQSSMVFPKIDLGRTVARVSYEQVALPSPIQIAPVDASTVVQNTSVNSNRTFNSVSIPPVNSDMRRKFIA